MRAIVLSWTVLASCASAAPSSAPSGASEGKPVPPPAPAGEPSPYDTPITLSLNRAPLQEAFSQIAKHSNLNVVVNGDVNTSATVTLSFKQVPAGEALEAVAKLFGFKVVRERYNIARITS